MTLWICGSLSQCLASSFFLHRKSSWRNPADKCFLGRSVSDPVSLESPSSLNFVYPACSSPPESPTWPSTGNRSGLLLLVLVMMWVLVQAPSPPLGTTRHPLLDLVSLPLQQQHFFTSLHWRMHELTARSSSLLGASSTNPREEPSAFWYQFQGTLPHQILHRIYAVDMTTFARARLSHTKRCSRVTFDKQHENLIKTD